jgi:4a-hydroxytetrahydrobiopterin dehydratase
MHRYMRSVPCSNRMTAFTDAQIAQARKQVPAWDVLEEDGIKKIRRTFPFKTFPEALAFTNMVGALSEAENHHPSIQIESEMVTVSFYTHKVNGLHDDDFLMARRIDQIAK